MNFAQRNPLVMAWLVFGLFGCAAPGSPQPSAPLGPRAQQAASPASRPVRVQGRPVEPGLAHQLWKVVRLTERMRQLPLLREPSFRVASDSEMVALQRRPGRGVAPGRDPRRTLLSGICPSPVSVTRTLPQPPPRALAVALYVAESGTIWIHERMAARLGHRALPGQRRQARADLVHEITHALQEQHFGLHAKLRASASLDQRHALLGMMEGDAALTRAMFLGAAHATGRAPDPSLVARMSAPAAWAGALMPEAEARIIALRYREGGRWAARRYRRGGWQAIDSLYGVLPTSMAAMLDLPVAPPGTPTAAPPPGEPRFARGRQNWQRDRLGPTEIYAYLGRCKGLEQIHRAWRDDQWLLEEGSDGRSRATWRVRLASRAAARQSMRAMLGHPSPPGTRDSPTVRQLGEVLVLEFRPSSRDVAEEDGSLAQREPPTSPR